MFIKDIFSAFEDDRDWIFGQEDFEEYDDMTCEEIDEDILGVESPKKRKNNKYDEEDDIL